MSSPSVITTNIDSSYYIPHLTNEVAAYVGYFEKGPINTPTLITDVNQFKFIFGRGIDLYVNDWYQVYNYLQYASGIWVTRVSGIQQYNANNGNMITILSKEDFEDMYESIELIDDLRIIAKTPGESGNLLSIAIFDNIVWDSNLHIGHNIYSKNVFSFFEEDHIGIVVFRKDKIVETFYLFIDDIKTIESKYVYFKFNNDVNLITTHIDNTNSELIYLKNGSVNFPTDDDIVNAHEQLANKDLIDLDIIIGNQFHNQAAINVAEKRRDCIAFIGLPTSYMLFLKTEKDQNDEVLYTEEGNILVLSETKIPKVLTDKDMQQLTEYVQSLNESQFVHFTANIKEQIDGFTNKKVLINIAGDIAGLKAKASLENPWTPGAGLERGIILNGEGIHINFNSKEKERLYKRGLNFIENGILISQKTFLSTSSSFNRINTRSLFNHIEKTIERTIRKYVFEENRESTRRAIAFEIKNILKDMRSNRGIEAGRVEVHKGSTDNEIIVDVYIKPLYVAEYIQLRINNIGTNSISNILSNTLG